MMKRTAGIKTLLLLAAALSWGRTLYAEDGYLSLGIIPGEVNGNTAGKTNAPASAAYGWGFQADYGFLQFMSGGIKCAFSYGFYNLEPLYSVETSLIYRAFLGKPVGPIRFFLQGDGGVIFFYTRNSKGGIGLPMFSCGISAGARYTLPSPIPLYLEAACRLSTPTIYSAGLALGYSFDNRRQK
ncbi:MAG: hypothetical protein LBR23_03635 [Spirochaetaceae bacterium]|jgi:hypothetical protein|nr:hypothetical protein [Spirochaetaceae bacterium]